MDYPIDAPGFEGQQVSLRIPGLFSGAILVIDGRPASRGAKRRQFSLVRDDGTEVVAELRTANRLDVIPNVVIDGKTFVVAAPLRWYQLIWAALPLGLVVVGGGVGGGLGATAMCLNLWVFRAYMNGAAKFVVSGIVSVAAVLTYLVVATLIYLAINWR